MPQEMRLSTLSLSHSSPWSRAVANVRDAAKNLAKIAFLLHMKLLTYLSSPMTLDNLEKFVKGHVFYED
jgi:hypothetical protein